MMVYERYLGRTGLNPKSESVPQMRKAEILVLPSDRFWLFGIIPVH